MDYEKYMFDNFEKMEVDGVWYPFESLKHEKEKLISIVKLRIDMRKDFEIKKDYKEFRKIIPPNQLYGRSGEITYSLQFKKDTGKLTEKERNLEPQIKVIDDKKWQKLKGRA